MYETSACHEDMSIFLLDENKKTEEEQKNVLQNDSKKTVKQL
jgi:hypothetical protein